MSTRQQNRIERIFILGLVVLGLLVSNCGKSAEVSNAEVAERLLNDLNKRLPRTQIKVKPENRLVKPVGNDRYRIIFKDCTFRTDLAWMVKSINKNLLLKDNPYTELDTVRIKEVVIFYGPKEAYLNLQSLNGMSLDCSDLETGSLGDFRIKSMNVSIGNITFNNLNISDLLKSGAKDFSEMTKKSLKEAFRPGETALKNLKFKLTGVTGKKEDLSILLEIEKIGSIKEGKEDPYIMVYLFKQDAPAPDLLKTLHKGLAVMDLNVGLGKANLSIKKNGIQWGEGAVESASYSQFVKPDKSRSSFKAGYSFGIKNLHLSLPGKREIEALSKIKEFHFNFSMEHLSPAAVLGLLEFVKKVIQLRDLADAGQMQEILVQAGKFWNEVFKSNPQIKCSISPFKHYLGELSLEAMIRQFFPPAAELKVKILKIDDILQKLEECCLFSPAAMKAILHNLEKCTIRKENGDASMTIELKPDQPGQYFLNGKPVMLRLY